MDGTVASFPRTGSTKVRSMVESLTGRPTGSEIRDPFHYQLGFLHEGWYNSSVIAVKTHWPDTKTRAAFPVSGVLLCIRNPFDVLLSWWNMRSTYR